MLQQTASLKIEEAIDGLEGIDQITSTSSEGQSRTTITVIDGYDPDRLLDRVRNEVDSITTFPEDAETPSITRPQIQKAVISLALISQMPEARLKEWADTVKKEVQRLPGVSQVNLSGTRSYEISIEISQANLLKYNLSLDEIAQTIKNSSLNQTGGTLKTSDQEIRLRTIGRKYTGNEFADIKIIKQENGQTVYLEDIAQIKDGFTENNLSIRANGQPAVLLNVLAGDEDTIKIADKVREYQESTNESLPQGSELIILSDNTQSTRANLDTLFSNAVMGLVLVFILLWLFMDTKISFWVGMGIPVSLLGGLAIVHFAGITLNKITLFGLIMVLGIVVDDAIVVGESIFYHRKKGASPLDAVIKGVSEVGLPVLASVLTTIVAFIPLYNIDGMMGKFIVALPTAVIGCLVISLMECMMVLPAHLSDLKEMNQPSTTIIVASIEFPEGTPFDITQAAVKQVETAAATAGDSLHSLSDTPLITNVLATIGQAAGEKAGNLDTATPNIGGVRVTLIDPSQSGIHSDDFILAWEKAAGKIIGVQSLDFSASNSGPPGAPIEICIQGETLDQITHAADQIAERLKTIDGVSQVYTDNAPGKNELKFTLKKEAEYLGVNLSDLGGQIYNAYYGAQALKIQRGNDEVQVNVRFTSDERQTGSSIQAVKIKTDDDTWVPLSAIADMNTAPGFSTITRKDGYRQVMVSAKVNTAKTVAGEVTAVLEEGLFQEIKAQYPDIQIVLEGDAKRSAESFGSLYIWVPIAIMGMFAIIATMFRSYIQPVLVLITIPFGLVGAVLGHYVMGHMLSLLSVFGMVALTGVVVNDAIVLIERINVNLEEGMEFFEAVFQGGVRRFRAVMLTSISTVGGLLPLILETSQYAQQLIPMGISLAFGVAFATVLTLAMIPCLYTIMNDLRVGTALLSGQREISRHTLEPAFQRNSGIEPVHQPI